MMPFIKLSINAKIYLAILTELIVLLFLISTLKPVSLTLYLTSSIIIAICSVPVIFAYFSRRNESNAIVLIGAMFVVVYPLSALFHLSSIERQKGFFPLVSQSQGIQYDLIVYSYIIILIAMAAMLIPIGFLSKNRSKEMSLICINKKNLLWCAIFCFIFSGIGIGNLFNNISEMAVIDRTRSFGGGSARYVFFLSWFPWGILLLISYFFLRNFPKSKKKQIILILFSLVLILLSCFWLGGRANLVINILPLIFLVRRLRPFMLKYVVLFSGLLITSAILMATILRSGHVNSIPLWNHVIQIIDWQMGRFSMVGMGQVIPPSSTSTIWYGVVSTVNILTKVLRLPEFMTLPTPISSITSEYVLGDPSSHCVVPGSVMELYYNGGIPGVVLGYACIGVILGLCIRIMRKTRLLSIYLLATFLVVTISCSFFSGTVTSWVYSVFTVGLPLIALVVSERVLCVLKVNKIKTGVLLASKYKQLKFDQGSV
jgi:oligosaccharide repeat unit polymerase